MDEVTNTRRGFCGAVDRLCTFSALHLPTGDEFNGWRQPKGSCYRCQ